MSTSSFLERSTVCGRSSTLALRFNVLLRIMFISVTKWSLPCFTAYALTHAKRALPRARLGLMTLFPTFMNLLKFRPFSKSTSLSIYLKPALRSWFKLKVKSLSSYFSATFCFSAYISLNSSWVTHSYSLTLSKNFCFVSSIISSSGMASHSEISVSLSWRSSRAGLNWDFGCSFCSFAASAPSPTFWMWARYFNNWTLYRFSSGILKRFCVLKPVIAGVSFTYRCIIP